MHEVPPGRDRAPPQGGESARARASSTRPSGLTARCSPPTPATGSRRWASRVSRSSGATMPVPWRLAQAALEIDPENATARRMIDRLEEVARFREAAAVAGAVALAASAAPEPAGPRRPADAAPRGPGGGHARTSEPASPVPPLAPRARAPAALPREVLMRVLVTGGAGYVGSSRSRRSSPPATRSLSSTTSRRAIARPSTPARAWWRQLRRRGRASRSCATTPVDAVLHCAARSLVGESIANPALYYRENVAGGVVLLEALREAGVKRLVFSSTAAVYGIAGRRPDPRGRGHAPDQPLRRDEAGLRGRAALVRRRLRPAERQPPLLQRRRGVGRTARFTTRRPTSSPTCWPRPRAAPG